MDIHLLKEAFFMNFWNWLIIEPFWDVVDVLRWIFNALFGFLR